ncbi:hypothetical protein ACTMKN_09085 [Bacteroides pyogenes]|uniref:hypothetical protein n=1 Tax=Bacteroides pyogenes TaxID=310300 RepID=UPI003F9B19A2
MIIFKFVNKDLFFHALARCFSGVSEERCIPFSRLSGLSRFMLVRLPLSSSSVYFRPYHGLGGYPSRKGFLRGWSTVTDCGILSDGPWYPQ